MRIEAFNLKILRNLCLDHSFNSIPLKVHIYDFRVNPSISMFLKQIGLYHFIECFNSQTDFCAVLLLKIPFIPYLYILFSFIICCTKSEIHKFMIPKPFLQLKYILWIYRPINCLIMDYIVLIRYLMHQIDKLYDALLPFLADGSG